MSVIDLTGRRFTRLSVIERVPRPANKYNENAYWLCVCDCGARRAINSSSLMTGRTKSCGCLRRPHGLSKSPEFSAWMRMLARCKESARPVERKYYWDKGVRVCLRWQRSFLNFLEDVGPFPGNGYTLDRFPDCNGNYEPRNVRWATPREQANNRRNSVYITVGTLTLTLAEWSRKLCVSDRRLRYKAKRLGITLADSVASFAR